MIIFKRCSITAPQVIYKNSFLIVFNINPISISISDNALYSNFHFHSHAALLKDLHFPTISSNKCYRRTPSDIKKGFNEISIIISSRPNAKQIDNRIGNDISLIKAPIGVGIYRCCYIPFFKRSSPPIL